MRPKKKANTADTILVPNGLSMLQFNDTDNAIKLIDINTKTNIIFRVIPKKLENLSPLSLFFFKSRNGIFI
mgnify:CR=1 FL=1